jgi:hypothetical protein
MKNLSTLLLIFSLGLPGFTQKKDTLLLLPGSNALQSDRLRDYSTSYNLYSYKDGEEKFVGSLEDHFNLKSRGKQALRVCKITFGPNHILDSGLCILKGLIPIYHRSVQSKKTVDLHFSKEKVSGKVITNTDADPKAETIDHTTPSPLFDSYYEDIIAKTVNLEKGVLFRFPEYIYERGGTVWSLGEVLKGVASDEHIVKFYELSPKKEVVRTTTYIVNESTREIIQREYLIGNNKIVMKKKPS